MASRDVLRDDITLVDVNAIVGGYLRDLAFAQSSRQKMFGYKRAAAASFRLLQGIEANVDAVGRLDLSNEEAATFT
jgi:hypothetical protein